VVISLSGIIGAFLQIKLPFETKNLAKLKNGLQERLPNQLNQYFFNKKKKNTNERIFVTHNSQGSFC